MSQFRSVVRRRLSRARRRARRRRHHPAACAWCRVLAGPLPVRPFPPARRGDRQRRTTDAWRVGQLVLAALAVAAALAILRGAAAPTAGAEVGLCRSGSTGALRPVAAADGPGSVTYAPPVAAPIADPFRPPTTPYGPGNRGLEYATGAGDAVRASAAGEVLFAGTVAGSLHVTLGHADGVRTSYSLLASVAVAPGQHVDRGELVGRAGDRLHLGARVGDVYLDPASLFAGGKARVELLPLEVPPGSSPDAEARVVAELALAEGWRLPGLGDVAGWLRDRAVTTVGYARELDLDARAGGVLTELGRRLLVPGECSEGPAPRRPAADTGRRVAVTVAGLGSSGADGAIDDLRTDDLGYAAGDVVRFSYRGGAVPGTGSYAPGIATSDYGAADTGADPRMVAGRLADLVEQVAGDDPDATIDVYAHSLGGVVARLALLELERRGIDLRRIGLVATLGTPHRGADLATVVTGVRSTITGASALDVLADRLGVGVDPGAPSVGAVAERSDVVHTLAEAGVPDGIRVVSIAARGDVVVAAPSTEVAGGVNVTVPVVGTDAHSTLVGSDAATRELGLALARLPPGCERWRDVVGDVVVGEGIALATDGLGFAATSSLP